MAVAIEFLQQQFARVPPLPGGDLAGQTVCVTGANSGLGFEMSKILAARHPAKLIVTCRNPQKMEEPLRDIEAAAGDETKVVVWDLDLSRNDSIKAFADKAGKESAARLDLLVLNAGIQLPTFSTVEGHETTLQTNVYGTMLLFFLLHPLMKATKKQRGSLGPARAIVVGSDGHTFISNVPLENLLARLDSAEETEAASKSSDSRVKANLPMSARYFLSKLILLEVFLRTCELIDADEVIFAMSNPGMCDTALTQHATGVVRILAPVVNKTLARTASTGSRCILWPAFIEDGRAAHGRYSSNCVVDYGPSKYVQSDEGKKLGRDLFDDLIKSLKQVDGRVGQVIH